MARVSDAIRDTLLRFDGRASVSPKVDTVELQKGTIPFPRCAGVGATNPPHAPRLGWAVRTDLNPCMCYCTACVALRGRIKSRNKTGTGAATGRHIECRWRRPHKKPGNGTEWTLISHQGDERVLWAVCQREEWSAAAVASPIDPASVA